LKNTAGVIAAKSKRIHQVKNVKQVNPDEPGVDPSAFVYVNANRYPFVLVMNFGATLVVFWL